MSILGHELTSKLNSGMAASHFFKKPNPSWYKYKHKFIITSSPIHTYYIYNIIIYIYNFDQFWSSRVEAMSRTRFAMETAPWPSLWLCASWGASARSRSFQFLLKQFLLISTVYLTWLIHIYIYIIYNDICSIILPERGTWWSTHNQLHHTHSYTP